jgi:hypothetical protein
MSVTQLEPLLVRAALGGEVGPLAEALAPDFDIARLPPGSLALLPLLYLAAERAEIHGPGLTRLKGVYRSVWVSNNLLVERIRSALDALAAVGVEPMLVGGPETALRFYGDLALRPTRTVSIVVSPSQFDAAVEVLRRFRPAPTFFVVRTVLDPGAPVPYEELRAAAEPLELGGVATRVAAAADELLAAAAGAAPGPFTRLQGLADTARIVTSGGYDADRLVALARAHRRMLRLLATLELLPDAAPLAEALRARPISTRERLEHRLARLGVGQPRAIVEERFGEPG